MPQTTTEYKKRVCKAMNYISRHIDRELSLEEIAEVAAFSKFHFHRIFKAVVGETVAEFTRRLRIEMACIIMPRITPMGSGYSISVFRLNPAWNKTQRQ